MRRLLGAVLVVAVVLARGICPATSSELSASDATLRRERHTHKSSSKRRLRIHVAEKHSQEGRSTDSSNVPCISGVNLTASDKEERGFLPSVSNLKYSKLMEDKSVRTSITKLLEGKKKSSLPKLRSILLRSMPLELASKLIFLKMPKNVPKPLPSTLPKGVKGFNFKIPGVSNAIIRLKMEIWFYYRIPPTFVFKKLGLVGKGTDEVLHAQENYKYFVSYFNAWYESQKFLIF
ncbi:secreted RxLR effector peptide protein, putative [Phytophthora infestans T30-4]|uniref:Secreted RxLR effector peptide protein, putative n=1 Tax=Phytophthora infestans (strain T30-4) TaxID=403677 RepID=D0NER1_PHYIT|nr:secreted RxLR effector peptide protein, putative [Phytophthora infestans T30-4]EEY56343.1 secreted RxLR effector peptide protein, putative [Phytophthora infestans T30-4]|eukprot:XP_002902417.1 secreted RxLR effector peptide protein, putative [Phytophthora infestans T30-4]